jgi:hypothetical protein
MPTSILAISAVDNLRCPTSAITDGVGQLLSRLTFIVRKLVQGVQLISLIENGRRLHLAQ